MRDPALTVPDREAIEAMEPFDRLGPEQIRLVRTGPEAHAAWQALQGEAVLGFDTESKPTFQRHEVSDGPHIVQLATDRVGYVFQLLEPACREQVAQILQAPHIVKAGFGLGDDKKRILQKLGVEPQGVLDLNHVFHQRGWRKDMGVKGAVAVMFQRRFLKSKKAATSNWAQPQLTPSQLLYAANDAYGALRVYRALGLD